MSDASQKRQTFSDTSKQFQAFLAQESVSSDIVWVFREDVVSRDFKIFVKEPLPDMNANIAESLYQNGLDRGFGVSLDVLCLLGSRHCCYVWLPEDDREAELHLLGGVKMSVGTNLPMATSVHSGLKWRWLRAFDDDAFWTRHGEPLPRRNI